MNAVSIYLMILGVSLATLLPRILPIALLSRITFPPLLTRWLSYVAPAVLGALTAVSVLAPQGFVDLSMDNIFIWAFIPTLFTAVKTRSLFLTLVIGIICMGLLYNLL